MDKILLIEDDVAMGAALEFSLSNGAYHITRATTVRESKGFLQRERFDLILLDVNLPDGSGYDLCKEIRAKSEVPIIFLTALDEEVNIVMGLEFGGNDYLTKPFGVQELVARMKVQLRKKQLEQAKHILESQDIRANLLTTNIYKGETILTLTALEYKLLVLFLQNPFRTLKREEILERISGSDGIYFDENTLSVYIKRLREKIEDDIKNPVFIVTKRGLGYQWNADVRRKCA